MKNSTTSVLGFENVPVSGEPETIQECIEAAGGEANLVGQWVGFVKAHRTNTEARGVITEALEEITGIARSTKQKPTPSKSDPNKTTEVYDESEQQYSDRVRAETKQTTTQLWEALASRKDSNGASMFPIPFKAVGEPRTGGVGRLAKMDTQNAETLLALDEKWQRAVQMLEQVNPGLKIAVDEATGKPTVEALASALRQNRARQQAETNAALGIAA